MVDNNLKDIVVDKAPVRRVIYRGEDEQTAAEKAPFRRIVQWGVCFFVWLAKKLFMIFFRKMSKKV